jgi:hypothetical protein
MKFTEIIARLNGLSCPVFGMSWTPSAPDVSIARRTIRFLEDRRVLYNDFAWEIPDQCVQSVLEIRKFLTSELGNLKDGSELAPPMKSMRAACRKFLNDMHYELGMPARPRFGNHSAFNTALGELRLSFGRTVASLAVQYGIDVEDELASILPVEDVD